jgi:tetratricopeptide (TPR) repeat protein
VTVQLLLPDGSEVLLEARVAYALSTLEAEAVGSDPGMGVQFTHMSEETGKRLQQLMADALDAHRGGPEGGERDPRLEPIAALIERSQFDRAVRVLEQMHNERPGRIDVRVLLHLSRARRARARFEFDEAIQHYRALLEVDPRNGEARDQLELLRGEAERTKALFERVFGRK